MNIIDTEIPDDWLEGATLAWVTSVSDEPSDGGRYSPVPRMDRPLQEWTFDVWNEEVEAVENLYHLCNGPANGFFARPPVDRYYIATAQSLGTATGGTQVVQLKITRGQDVDILYPVAGTITVYANGSPLTITTHWTLGSLGEITVTGATLGQALTWTGQYKTPFQFVDLRLTIDAQATVEMPTSVTIREIPVP